MGKVRTLDKIVKEVEADNQVCINQENCFQNDSKQLKKTDIDRKKHTFPLEPLNVLEV